MKKKKQIAVDVPSALSKRLRQYAAAKGVSYSSVVEVAVERYLDRGPHALDRLRQHDPKKRVTYSALVEAALTDYLDDPADVILREPEPEMETMQQAFERMFGKWRGLDLFWILGPPHPLDDLLAEPDPRKLRN